MRRREVLKAGLGGVLIGTAGCTGSGSARGFSEGFEDGIGQWEADAAIGPEVDIEEFDWELGVSTDQAASGTRSLRIWNEGDYDDGVTWAVHPVDIDPDRAYQITVTAQFWSESGSFNTLRDAVLRLGPEPPEVEEDFPQPGVNTGTLGQTPYGGLREPLWLAEGWREYSFGWTTPELATRTVYVAVGTSVIWEGDATHFVDDVSVEIESR